MYDVQYSNTKGTVFGVWFMKKRIPIIMICAVCVLSSMCVGANDEKTDVQSGFAIVVNGEATEYISIIRDNTHYLPM